MWWPLLSFVMHPILNTHALEPTNYKANLSICQPKVPNECHKIEGIEPVEDLGRRQVHLPVSPKSTNELGVRETRLNITHLQVSSTNLFLFSSATKFTNN
jgi:hypothetical protein